MKNLAYMSLVRPMLEHGVWCWDPYGGGQTNALDLVQKKAAKFANHKNYSGWERQLTLAPSSMRTPENRLGIYRGEVERTTLSVQV